MHDFPNNSYFMDINGFVEDANETFSMHMAAIHWEF